MSQQSGKRGSKSAVIVVLAMAIIASLVATVPAFAGSISDQPAAQAQAQAARPLGVVPVRGGAQPSVPAATLPLVYHNGPVMHTNKVYAIYWIPTGYTVSANYQSLINGFFSNVAADSGKTSNVYFSDTQYYQTSGRTKTFISYNSTFGGSVVDTHALPASGCTDLDTSVCLTDAQLQTEIQSVAAAQGWTANATTEFYMFTARGIGSCFDSTGASCAFTQYCAYHSWIGSGSSATLYANMPYADTVSSACDAGQHPNNDDADATINVTSHEHNETITDPQGTAWWDRTGAENGDKCAWNFGTALGNNGHGLYNQAIGTGQYYLQQEWSNFSRGCVLTNK